MRKYPSQKHRKSTSPIVGGNWLPNVLIWGGVLLMFTGGVVAYPTLQDYLAPPDPENLQFSVTLAPSAAGVAAVIEATDTIASTPTDIPPDTATSSPQATELHSLQANEPTATATAPPPLLLPETKLVEKEDAPTPAATLPEATATPEATPAPTVTPSPTPTPDPASLIPSRLLIPSINLDAPVLQVGWESTEVNGQTVSQWIVPDEFAAGWHSTSALPGLPGNTVLSGHHNIYGEVFRDLEDLNPGDGLVLYSGETLHYYAVTELHILAEKGQSEEVRRQNAQFIMPSEDERLTLVTCWPYTNNTHRLVIVALPMEPTPTPTPMAK